MPSVNDYYPITGIQDGLDPKKDQTLRKVPLRMEIDDWYTSTDVQHINQRALFFPAFWKFSQMDPHEKLSYFQIAGKPALTFWYCPVDTRSGIHGKPFIAWDEPPTSGETDNKGYCTHNSILFCTWHRPYLLLFEVWSLVIHTAIQSLTPSPASYLQAHARRDREIWAKRES